MAELALFGGKKTRERPFPPHPVIGAEEKKAAMDVLESGKLSTFLASPGEYFNGGRKIREFEAAFCDYHHVKFAVAFNSATAALHAAVVGCGVKPGEEVITTPYTMGATATCALMNNSVPVFADVDGETFNLSASEVEKAVTPLSRAVIPVHLFGAPVDMDAILEVARKHGLKVIEDAAQAPGARYRGKPVGTLGDCGIFSFTETKQITSGEGGMLITNDEKIAEAARLVRNHGEAIISGRPRTYNSTILGWNYRMTEIDAAIGLEQFRKMDRFNAERRRLGKIVFDGFAKLGCFTPQRIPNEDTPSHFFVSFRFDERKAGISRKAFVDAMNAEGIPMGGGYVKPLYFSYLYHENKPFIYQHYKGKASYEPGLCPVAERLHEKEVITILVCRPPATDADMADIVKAAEKVLKNKSELKDYKGA